MHVALQQTGKPPTRPAAGKTVTGRRTPGGALRELRNWVNSQLVNGTRHANSVRMFQRGEFGDGPHAPKEANLRAVNTLLKQVSGGQTTAIAKMLEAGSAALTDVNADRLATFTKAKDAANKRTRLTEKVWLFYFNLFDQRTGPFARQLHAMDRIALDCYQVCYMGLGAARSIPTPPPMAYIDAGYGPATYRRGVRMSKIGKRENPFPLVKLPHHRLINPWSLGAVPHEIGHNLQNDLSLWPVAPKLIRKELEKADLPNSVIRVWMRWHKEIYADLIGDLLIGPYYISSLLDVVGKSQDRVAKFNPSGVHPTSYLRPLINTELLRQIGFQREADAFEQGWRALYPAAVTKSLPSDLVATFQAAARGTIKALCFTPHSAYGGKALAEVVRFRQQDLVVVREAARRLADGTSPGIVPERFLICAAREALQEKLAPPERLAANFYNVLTG